MKEKQVIGLTANWHLREVDVVPPTANDLALLTHNDEGDWLAATMPAQVHDVLLADGRIEDPANFGAAAKCVWVGERNWVYRTRFDAPPARRQRLCFAGLDTLAEIYLNGEHIASHDNMYLPLDVDVSGKLRETDNVLFVFFTSPWQWLERHPLPAHLEGKVPHNRLLRKPHEDFNGFNGAHPYYTTIGIFGDVRLINTDAPDLGPVRIHAAVDDQRNGSVRVTAHVHDCRAQERVEARIRILAPDGAAVAETVSAAWQKDGATIVGADLSVSKPDLWFPRGYGAQPLYAVDVQLICAGHVVDELRKHVGFRTIEVSDNLDVQVNGLAVRIWGANWTPVDGHSKCYNRARTHQTLALAEHANCVSLRIWGPGGPWHEDLYDECDRRGLLTWAEFFHTWGAYPDMPEYLESCRREAAHEVQRLHHHPSIFVWCGGNEVYMGWQWVHGNIDVPGKNLYEEIYPRVVRALDPEARHYLINSPFGGAFPNDARAGESHAYTHQNFVPGADYPVFFAENTRVSTPLLKSMQRFIPADKFWPEGFTGMVPIRRMHAQEALPQARAEPRRLTASALPPAWHQLTLGADFLGGRLGPVGDFYDTGDSPEGLIYRLGAAHSRWLRDNVERYRRGYPWHATSTTRRCRGHYLWKFNSTWPMIYSDVVDYLLEPNMTYYALRRAYAPVLVSLDISDHIRLWVVNDSATPVEGILRACLYSPDGTKVLHEDRHSVSVAPGRSELIGTLDGAGMFPRACNLFAELIDGAARQLARTNDIAALERNISFPDARLNLAPNDNGDGVVITTDAFARCVELKGNALDGDAFGWHFEDNFFDLLPHERKEVRVLGRHRHGDITAGSMFVTNTARLKL